MNWENLIVQLGISGLVVYVGFKVAMKLIDKWSQGDSERTQAIKEGFAADIAAHNEITKTMIAMQSQMSRTEGKLDIVLDLTPVRALHAAQIDELEIQTKPLPSVIVDHRQLKRDREEDDTPVDRPPTPQPMKQVKRAGSEGIYGLRDTPKPRK